MKKRILSFFLCTVVLLTSILCVSVTSFAATGQWTSGSLTVSLANDGTLTVSGNGTGANYTSATNMPWNSSKSSIKNIVIKSGVKSIGNYAFYGCTSLETIVFEENSTVETIGSYAFYNCSNTTYWLNLPESLKTIGANAFNNTGFNWVTFDSPKISIQTNSFGQTGWAQFSGLYGSGVKEFVQNGKNAGYTWKFLCLRDHQYIIAGQKLPTCTDDGYTVYHCTYCEADNLTESTPAAGHNFSTAKATGKGTFAYTCSKCNLSNIEISALTLLNSFDSAISHEENSAAFNQSNYNADYDVHRDGYISAKDFLLIERESKNVNVTGKETTINTNTKYQTIDGFGASGAWWAQDLGRWSDKQIDVVTELLYGETGAGLDVYRYNLGGGSENDTAIGDWRRRAEDFLSSSSNINNPATYDWNADAAAQKVLASVKRANPDFKLTLFSNTPPVSLTKNGKGYCDPHTTSSSWSSTKVVFNENLASSNYQNFATYLCNCAKHFIDQGYNVTEISPINEPGWAWDGPSQEGCHYTAANARTFYNNYMIPAITKDSQLNGKVGVSVWECEQLQINSRDGNSDYYKTFLPNMFSSSTVYKRNNENIRNYVDSFDTHSYWASTAERQTTANDIKGSNYSTIKKVRCTEYCQMTNDGNNNTLGYLNDPDNGGDYSGLDIYFGLALADIMYQDLTILNASEWDWWVACADGGYPDGLVYADYNNPNDIKTSKRLWVMGNWARFVEEGAVRVQVTTGSNFGKNLTTAKTYGTDKINYLEQTAYLNPDGSIVVVYINNSDTDEYTTFGTAYNTFESYVTDANRDLEKYQYGGAGNTVIHIPHKSVTTVVLK